MRAFLQASAIAGLGVGTATAGVTGFVMGILAIDEGSVPLGCGSIALLCVALIAYLAMYRRIGAYRRQHTDEQLPDELTAPLTFRPNPRKYVLFLAISALIVAGGVLVLRGGDALGGAFAIAFGLLCAVVFAWSLLPGKQYLQISAEGLTWRALGRTQRYAWHEVGNFHARDATGADDIIQRRICFDLTAGGHSALPENYGLNPLQLADELNRYCERYGSPPARGR